MAVSMISSPALADRKGRNTAYILGGVIGGLVLADIFSHKKSHARSNHGPVIIEPQPRPRRVEYCWQEPRSVWDNRYHGYVTYYVERCEWRR
jgi:hypothetical protein